MKQMAQTPIFSRFCGDIVKRRGKIKFTSLFWYFVLSLGILFCVSLCYIWFMEEVLMVNGTKGTQQEATSSDSKVKKESGRRPECPYSIYGSLPCMASRELPAIPIEEVPGSSGLITNQVSSPPVSSTSAVPGSSDVTSSPPLKSILRATRVYENFPPKSMDRVHFPFRQHVLKAMGACRRCGYNFTGKYCTSCYTPTDEPLFMDPPFPPEAYERFRNGICICRSKSVCRTNNGVLSKSGFWNKSRFWGKK
jgi:hypothetical protein